MAKPERCQILPTANPRIVVINLPTSTDRRQDISEHLADLGLEYEFFDAIDGRQMSVEEIASVYAPDLAKTTQWGELTRGEIGCALSHQAIWQALVDSGERGWLVLEDDAQLARDVPNWLARLQTMVADGEVVPFVSTSKTPYFFGRVRLGDRWIVYPNQAFVLATAYYITPLAARRLLEASRPIWFPIDCWYSQPGFKSVTPIRAIWPEAVSSRDTDIANSTIGFRQAHQPKPVRNQGWLRSRLSSVRRYLKNRFFLRPVRIK